MSKYTEELIVWFEQGEKRKEVCDLDIKSYEKSIENLLIQRDLINKSIESISTTIKLEQKQKDCIDKEIERIKKEWNYGKEE